jgi:hypothetical protein
MLKKLFFVWTMLLSANAWAKIDSDRLNHFEYVDNLLKEENITQLSVRDLKGIVDNKAQIMETLLNEQVTRLIDDEMMDRFYDSPTYVAQYLAYYMVNIDEARVFSINAWRAALGTAWRAALGAAWRAALGTSQRATLVAARSVLGEVAESARNAVQPSIRNIEELLVSEGMSPDDVLQITAPIAEILSIRWTLSNEAAAFRKTAFQAAYLHITQEIKRSGEVAAFYKNDAALEIIANTTWKNVHFIGKSNPFINALQQIFDYKKRGDKVSFVSHL